MSTTEPAFISILRDTEFCRTDRPAQT